MQKKLKIALCKTSYFVLFGILTLTMSKNASAQTTTSHSPYSQFGLGQMREDLLPQTRAMGGIAAGVRYQSGLSVLNVSNPASYSAMTRTILEAGLYANGTQLSKGSASDYTADFAFSHFALGIPLSKAGGLAFGLLPYSDVGYSSSGLRTIEPYTYRTSVSGEGGLNKAFAGYGISPIKGLSVGANVGFIFGNLKDIDATEFAYSMNAYNTFQTDNRLIRGITFDYGVQYFKALGNKMNFTVGYSGSLNNTINDYTTRVVTRSRTDPSSEVEEQVAIDTTFSGDISTRKINLPMKHNVGFTLSKGYNWMVGADFKYADWSGFQTRTDEPKLGKNYGVAIGGQIKPDPTSIRYMNQVDYRLGVRYNKTHLTVNNHRIDDMAITVGMGFPLPETNFGRTFSTINVSAEFGQQGTMTNNLVRERYININLGFTINDTWFMRRSYD
ncbi:hypothetical protein [Sphingobacterium hungaricum]|nr:hypothetical protein [Sphingobacterium hungaricum]